MVVKRAIFSILLVLSLGWLDLPVVRAQQLIMLPKGRRYAPPRNPSSTTTPPAPKEEEPKTQVATNAPDPVVPTNRPILVRVEPKPDPVKIASEKEAVLKNTLEYEKSRANEGSGWAQYKMGLRYLNGDGVEKNEVAGRKWLQVAADNGESQAQSKLKALDAKASEAAASKVEATQ